jgi:hypothetical protein
MRLIRRYIAYSCFMMNIQWVPGASSLGVKRPGSEANHSPPSSTEVKNGGDIPQLPYTSSWRGA